MKVGCAVWCFTKNSHMDSPYEEPIKTISELGFQGFELIVFTKKYLNEYYTKNRVKQLVELYESHELTLSEFVIFHQLVEGLASFHEEEKKKGIETFKKGVQLAKDLGTKIVNTVAHWPIDLESPVEYLSSYVHPCVPGVKWFSPKLSMKIPSNFSWKKTWENYLDSIGTCADIASDQGLLLALEGHAHAIVSHTDSFLRLFSEVNSNALGMNFDTSWQSMQREYLPISIYKLGKKVFHVHARDTDGLLFHNLPPGQGITDWEEVIKALKGVGYEGFLSIEIGGYKEPEIYTKQGKEYLENILMKLRVS